MTTVTPILEKIDVCLSFYSSLALVDSLYVPEYILALWLLKEIFIKSDDRSVWRAPIRVQVVQKQGADCRKAEQQSPLCILGCSSAASGAEAPLDPGAAEGKVCCDVSAGL